MEGAEVYITARIKHQFIKQFEKLRQVLHTGAAPKYSFENESMFRQTRLQS